MKKSFLCILCTAYCNIIMPQIDNNVDNICNTVIMEVVIICMKSSLKKKEINNSTCQPFSSHNHYFPNNHPDNNKLGCLSHSRTVNSWIATKKKGKKRDQNVLLGLFSLFHHIHALTLLSVWSHISLLVEKYIHMIYKKKVKDEKHRREVSFIKCFRYDPSHPRFSLFLSWFLLWTPYI